MVRWILLFTGLGNRESWSCCHHLSGFSVKKSKTNVQAGTMSCRDGLASHPTGKGEVPLAPGGGRAVTQSPGLAHTHTPALSPATAKNKNPHRNRVATRETPSKQINDAVCPRSPWHRWGDEQTNLWSMAARREVSEQFGFIWHTTLQQSLLSSAAVNS